MSAQERARDTYAVLCCLYGEHNAQALMHVRGATQSSVARLARAMGRSSAAISAARNYRFLTSLRGGYMRLMTACNNDGAVKRLVDAAGAGRRFAAWEIDAAINVVIAVVDTLPAEVMHKITK